jgi:hypothetical protein
MAELRWVRFSVKHQLERSLVHSVFARKSPARFAARRARHRTFLALIAFASSVVFAADSGPFCFEHRFIDADAPFPKGVYGFGLTALADLDRDGDLDFITGHRRFGDPVYWYECRAPDDWVRHRLGGNHQSDVGLAVLDVDRDGSLDVVTSGVWFRNPPKPREAEFERHVFDSGQQAGAAHDVLAADVDGDGRLDVVVMADTRKPTNIGELCWYRIADDPTQPWHRHRIGPSVHGAITPAGAADIDGDGDLDVIRADSWFENVDGRGLRWTVHANLGIGRVGPFGICVRTAAVDLDGDRVVELVVADADIVPCHVYVLRNADGRGGRWEKQVLPQSIAYGSLHSLAVADFDGDGDLDILSNEQEDMLPPGRTDPRWVIWENQGSGKFVERVVLDRKLGGHEVVVGDVDGDGDIDICSKPWKAVSWNGAGGKFHIDYLENKRIERRATAPASRKGAR